MVKEKLTPYYIAFKETRENCNLTKNRLVRISALEANIIRQLHGIEKGLCLENPRLGFGFTKVQKLFAHIESYMALDAQDRFCLYMARDALQAYMDFHKDKNFTNADVEKIGQKLEWLKAQLHDRDGLYGGTLTLKKDEITCSTDQIEKLFRTRHSIRAFSGEPVSQEEIKKAIALAQLCPSACNRQCARVYFVDKQKYMTEMNTDLQGIGGFADDAYGFLLVTGRKSAYNLDERNQYLVSASIFAGYLSLALHTYGIASCVVQRSVSPNVRWEKFKKTNAIAEDEQIVLMLAIGKYKEETRVPISKRFPVDRIYKVLE